MLPLSNNSKLKSLGDGRTCFKLNKKKNQCKQLSLRCRSSRPEVFCCRPCNFIKKGTLAQVFSGEFCKISKNTFFYRTPPVAASGDDAHYHIVVPWCNKWTNSMKTFILSVTWDKYIIFLAYFVSWTFTFSFTSWKVLVSLRDWSKKISEQSIMKIWMKLKLIIDSFFLNQRFSK